MCKICTSCKGVMNYDPYFEAEICGKCGRMERKERKDIQRKGVHQHQSVEIMKQIVGVMLTH